MSLLVNIADIPISIRKSKYLKMLNRVEINLLKPFIMRKRIPNDLEERYFSVNVKIINNIVPQKNSKKINPELAEKIRLHFFCNNDGRFKKILNFYLINVKVNNNLLKSNKDYNKIIVGNNSFLIFDKKSRQFDIYYRKPDFPKNQQYLYNKWPYNLNVLRLLMRMILHSSSEGVILHASSIEDNGYGYIFIGPAGSGKSTVVKLFKPDRVLSDDTTVIKRVNNLYQIFPNPWWNVNPNINIQNPTMPALLRAVFFIKRARKASMKKLNYKESLAMLIYGERTFQQIGFFDNKTGIRNFYLFSQDLVHDIPVFELKIKKSNKFKEEFYTLLKHHLGKNE